MSWQIPTQVELDIIAGKAVYKTFQTGNGGQSILQVPPNSYAVIFGYDFSPAGGGFVNTGGNSTIGANTNELSDSIIRFFETQQISFYTGTDFFPFIHHVHAISTPLVAQRDPVSGVASIVRNRTEIDSTPIARQVYITSNNDITITVGLILTSTASITNAIPVTNRTPNALTYGGSGQVVNTQTNFGPGGTPQQFIQPSPKDFADFGFGALPGNADNQAFATPNATNGLIDPSFFITGNLGGTFANAAACNYYLCLHYAIYSQAIPEQRG